MIESYNRMYYKRKLTATESLLVSDFLKSARALPKTVCIELNDWDEDDPTLEVLKRIGQGIAVPVAGLRKKSLCFSLS